MNYTVYMHITPNRKMYIGITSRKPQYRWNYGKGYVSNKHFYNAILKYGWDNIEHIIVAECLSKEDACAMEQKLIAKYDTTNPSKGYNRSIGDEAYRRKGYGKLLVSEMEKRAKEMGVNTIRLDTFSWQGKEFYESLNYEVVGSYENTIDGYMEYFFMKRI